MTTPKANQLQQRKKGLEIISALKKQSQTAIILKIKC